MMLITECGFLIYKSTDQITVKMDITVVVGLPKSTKSEE